MREYNPNIIGKRFGSFEVISGPYKNSAGRSVYEYRCECGSLGRLTPSNLRQCEKRGFVACRVCRIQNFTGKRFGKLTAVRRVGSNKHRVSLWECLCDCGNTKVCSMSILQTKRVRSCGCYRPPMRRDLLGQIFGRWSVVEYDGYRHDVAYWWCRCECGTEKSVRAQHLISKVSLSCGCYMRDMKKSITGDKHPNWNPDLTEEERLRHREPEQSKWSLEIKRKYGFTCVVCGLSRANQMVSHHLDGYSKNKELRTDLDNGVCLCEDCHKQFHKEYGYKNNTRQQFYEWAKDLGKEFLWAR